MGSGSAGGFGDAVTGVSRFGGAYVNALRAGDFYNSCQWAGEVVARARVEVMIGAGSSP